MSFLGVIILCAAFCGQPPFVNSLSDEFPDAREKMRIVKFERRLMRLMKYFDVYDREQDYSLFYLKKVHFDIPVKELVNDSIFLANMKPGKDKEGVYFENYYANVFINDTARITRAGMEIFCKDGYNFYSGGLEKGDELINTYFSEGMDDCFVSDSFQLNNYFMTKNGRLYLFRYDYINGGIIFMPYEEALADPETVLFLW